MLEEESCCLLLTHLGAVVTKFSYYILLYYIISYI